MRAETKCLHSGETKEAFPRGVNTPIEVSSSFQYLDSGEVLYPRYFNTPNQAVINRKLAALEGGEASLLFASGMAAISTTLFSIGSQGDHFIFQNDLYGGTLHLIAEELERYGMEYSLVSGEDLNTIEAAIRPNTKLIYIESPSNPLLKITDIAAVAQLAKDHGILTAIDNTFASPINQQPLSLGIDITIHSGTKYFVGHSDLCCGAVISTQAMIDTLHHHAMNYGGSLNALDCYILERSLKTLALRVERQCDNAMGLAQWLQQHPAIAKVHYPGLESHPHHDIARKQMKDFGAVIAFEVDGQQSTATEVMKRFQLIQPALSLGGIESIACLPAKTSHAKLTEDARQQIGISENLIRFSVGIEHIEDLKSDLQHALEGSHV